MGYICENIGKNEEGHLTFAGADVTELAAKFKTPLYMMDEERIRHNCRLYTEAFERCFPRGSMPLYAGKANCFKQIYRIMTSEKMGIDVVSAGEIFTAFSAGYDMSQAFFHGNSKTDSDIRLAIDCMVGYIVVDSVEELEEIEREAAWRQMIQKILIRVTPGIDTHTYEAVNTGKVDSKFGAAIETGQAEQLTALALQKKHVKLKGFHCHVGSQVFEEDVFERTAKIMIGFAADMKEKLGFEAECLNLGGGFGVRYVDTDPKIDIPAKIESIASAINAACDERRIKVPCIFMEPGRSIVADAGMTLYRTGTVKNIPGYKTYVSVDGGMADNPRFALYRSKYTCLNADRQNEENDMSCSLVGRCCESGDIIAENIQLPSSTARNDIIAVCTTGAYNYSMASNYNRLGKPAVVMVKNGEPYIAVKRETLEDIARQDELF